MDKRPKAGDLLRWKSGNVWLLLSDPFWDDCSLTWLAFARCVTCVNGDWDVGYETNVAFGSGNRPSLGVGWKFEEDEFDRWVREVRNEQNKQTTTL